MSEYQRFYAMDTGEGFVVMDDEADYEFEEVVYEFEEVVYEFDSMEECIRVAEKLNQKYCK